MPTHHHFIRFLGFPASTVILDDSTRAFMLLFQTRHFQTGHLFDELRHRDIYKRNSQLASFIRNGDSLATWALFSHAHHAALELDSYTFPPVLRACSALTGTERGRQVHSLMVKLGTDMGAVAKTALMDMYSKVGCLEESVRVFEEFEFKDVVTWNALISSFLRHGLSHKAIGTFAAMRLEGVAISEFTLCSVLKACASLEAFQQGKQVHGLIIVLGRDLVILGTALIDFYSELGYVYEAIRVPTSLNVSSMDSVMINSLISGCVKNRKYKEAFSIVSRIRPDVVTLTSALAACSENSDLWIGKQIHCVALRLGLTYETHLCNAILDMYAKCGKVSDGRSVFDGILDKSVFSWTSMIDAYGSHGYGHEALELFERMREERNRVLPNSVTFLVVLSACQHSGLVKESQYYFNLMKNYGLELGQEHYACFIDTLGKAGQMDEVWILFDEMVKHGISPTTGIWVTLLNACILNLDRTRGEVAAKRLLELEDDRPEIYVLLSNFYAAVGKWDAVDNLRDRMREKGLAKEAGNSRVTATAHGKL